MALMEICKPRRVKQNVKILTNEMAAIFETIKPCFVKKNLIIQPVLMKLKRKVFEKIFIVLLLT